MAMTQDVARDRLSIAVAKLGKLAPKVELRERYVRGDQDLPFAPYGVNAEYLELRKQSIANFLRIAVDAPVQRMGVDSMTTGLGTPSQLEVDGRPDPENPDALVWANIWQANKLDVRQSLVYESMFVHGRGIVGVWEGKRKDRPIVRPEKIDRVHIEPDPDDPFEPLWAAKVYKVEVRQPTSLYVPSGVDLATTKTVGIVYDADQFWRFERSGEGFGATGAWEAVGEPRSHGLGRIPFALYDMRPDGENQPQSPIDTLMAQQDAVNTIRFNTLLAMQFAAFRQRIVTGFDPRVVDAQGNVMFRTNPDGTPKLDENGNMVPMVQSPGRVGVDRLLSFPGESTKVFDLPESNLDNYITVYDRFLTTFFATGQIPPQYLLTQMANLSGDALAAAESTLSSLVQQMQIAAGEGHEDMMSLGWRAMGRNDEFPTTAETNWADREARSFSAIADAITKLISVEFPHRSAFEMLPGATRQKVERWMDEREDEQYRSTALSQVMRPTFDATTSAQPLERPGAAELTEGGAGGAA